MNNNGFTFIELLISLVILSVGLIGLAAMTKTSVNSNYYSKNMTIATALGQDKMEDLKRQALAAINGVAGANFLNTGTTAETNIDENGAAGGNYTRTTTITNGGANQLTQIDVAVSWTGTSTHTCRFTTLIRQ